MRVTPIGYNNFLKHSDSCREHVFGHGNESFWKSDYSKKDKLIVAGTTTLGVVASLAGLAKAQGNSIKPKAFLKYLKNADFLFKEIVAMGAGTCIGGLAGGYIIDKDPLNRKAKRREAVMQIGNITIPIATVAGTNLLCDKFNVSKITAKGQAARTISCLGAIIAGIYLANYAMNKLSNVLFKNKSEERDVKATDLSPHLDDVLASAKYVAPKSKVVHYVSRIVPFALMVAGNEVGNKKAGDNL